MTTAALYQSKLTSLPLIQRGKVRDVYAVGAQHLLIVTTDRISAFDVVLGEPVPGKGAVLTALSNFWFARLQGVIRNHLSKLSLSDVLPDAAERATVEGRAVIVDKLRPLAVEAIVRGYIIGSGWKDYQRTGQVCGITLPAGLQQAQQLPQPIFTPSTKAEMGDHDENIDFERTCALLGRARAEQVRDVSVKIYQTAADFARDKGIIIADTKFEFGLDANDELVLIDEVLTPDSSRFWPADQYQVGISPPSFDKQFVRDYLETLDWDKRAPAPALPKEILEKTAARCREALTRLTA
jgi:phosphoribosylaminoimidazole-succinocarboxamide synthase